jgi:LysR family transcriptional activator of dmlA
MDGPNGPESVNVTGPMGSHHSDVVRNWALDGLGIVLLSSWDVDEQLRTGSLVRVLPGYSEAASV